MTGFSPALDLFPALAGLLAAVSCGLLGNFLVLRRLSLMGDAISHSVLPGLVIAFMITATRNPIVMFVGAAAAGVATVILVELVRKLGRVEPGAAMGVVFSVFFALGVLLIEQAAARQVDLDADCVLHGQLETLMWYGGPQTWSELRVGGVFSAAPRPVITLLIMAFLTVAFVTVLFKELRIAAFDPELATTQGYHAGVLHYVLMIFVAAATVASFEAVGSILVIAMLICPAATARLMTDRLRGQIGWSVLLAATASLGGYALATLIPAAFGRDAVNAAGMMSVAAGGLLVGAIIVSPRDGLIVRAMRRRRLRLIVASDDILAALYRASEAGVTLSAAALRGRLPGRAVGRGLDRLARLDLVESSADQLVLTTRGRRRARAIVRRHRLWEHYLVDTAGLAPDHVHETAERLEHIPLGPSIGPSLDPHGRSIPEAGASTDEPPA